MFVIGRDLHTAVWLLRLPTGLRFACLWDMAQGSISYSSSNVHTGTRGVVQQVPGNISAREDDQGTGSRRDDKPIGSHGVFVDSAWVRRRTWRRSPHGRTFCASGMLDVS